MKTLKTALDTWTDPFGAADATGADNAILPPGLDDVSAPTGDNLRYQQGAWYVGHHAAAAIGTLPSAPGIAASPTVIGLDDAGAPASAVQLASISGEDETAASGRIGIVGPPTTGVTSDGGGGASTESADIAVAGPLARAQYTADGDPLTGEGVKIGIISDSYQDLGGFPDVTVLPGGAGMATDEGGAMAEIAFDTAPDAQYYFYTAGYSDSADPTVASFVTAVQQLQAAGCNIIVDDIGLNAEPFFEQSGPDAAETAVESYIAGGGNYFTAAGNDGSAFDQATFDPINVTIPGIGSVTAMNFGTAESPSYAEPLTIMPGTKVLLDLQWDQPFPGIGGNTAGAQYSLGWYVLDSSGNIVAQSTEDDVGAQPVQLLDFTTPAAGSTSYKLVVVLNGGSVVGSGDFRFQFINGGGSRVTISDPNAGQAPGGVFGYATVPGVNVVGATNWATTPSNGYFPPTPETFSEYGYDDISFVAPDGAATNVPNFPTFTGTSAAAPVAAAVAALMLQANPDLTNTEISTYLEESAISMGDGPQVGAGLIQADTALGLAQNDFMVTTEQEFDEAVQAVDLDSANQQQDYTITLQASFTMTGVFFTLPSIDLQNASTLDVQGANFILGFDAMDIPLAEGTLTLTKVTINNAGVLVDNDEVDLSASSLFVTGLEGEGEVFLEQGSTLTVAGPGLSSASVDFGDPGNTLQLTDPADFASVIAGFAPGDTIDLAAVGTLNAAALGTGNGLTVSGLTSGPFTLNLDPDQDFGNYSFLLAPDTNAGTAIALLLDTGTLAFTASYQTLLVVNPANLTGTITDFAVGDVIDLAGVGTATGVSLNTDGNQLKVEGLTNGNLTLNLGAPGGYSSDDFFVEPDGNGGTDIVPYGVTTSNDTGVDNLYATMFSGVNNAGLIVGSYQTINMSLGTGTSHGLIYDAGVFTSFDMQGVTNLAETYAEGVNDAGTIVGYYTTFDPVTYAQGTHGFVDTAGTFTSLDVPDITNLTATVATGISDSGEIIGYYNTTNTTTLVNTEFGFVDTLGDFTTITLPGVANVVAIEPLGINGAGQIVGYYTTDDPNTGEVGTNGFLDNGGSVTLFSVSGIANVATTVPTGINASGQIVGFYTTYDPSSGATATHGFLDTGGNFISFDVVPGSFEDETMPNAINNAGEIVGFDEYTGSLYPLFTDAYYAGQAFIATDIACFAAGTRITTPAGDVPVERLRAGDAVLTRDGARPIAWIGRRRLDLARHPQPARARPIRIARDAFASGIPARDLYLSPNHAIFWDGLLIEAKRLINATSIVQTAPPDITYFHIELADHDIILAEALSAETYLDTGNRAMFENAPGPITLHPDLAGARAGRCCAKLVFHGAELARIRRHLIDRAAKLGYATTRDPGLHIIADGQRIEPIRLGGDRLRFAIPRGARTIRLKSRTGVPAQLLADATDDRILGAFIAALSVTTARGRTTIDPATLTEGFYPPEPDGIWTNGDAALHLPSPCLLEIALTGTLPYPHLRRAA